MSSIELHSLGLSQVFEIYVCYRLTKVRRLHSKSRGGFRRGSWGSVEPLLDTKFMRMFLYKFVFTINILTINILTPYSLPLMFFKSILLPVNVCKMAGWVANSADPDRFAASDLGLLCLLRHVCKVESINVSLIKSNPPQKWSWKCP